MLLLTTIPNIRTNSPERRATAILLPTVETVLALPTFEARVMDGALLAARICALMLLNAGIRTTVRVLGASLV